MKKAPKAKPHRRGIPTAFAFAPKVLERLDEIVAERRRVRGRGSRTEVVSDLIMDSKEGRQETAAD